MNRWALIIFIISVLVGYNLYDDFNPDSLRGARVLVTGASSGIGEQMAYHYARMGARILITARTEARLQQVISECRRVGFEDGDYHYITADMQDYTSTHAVIQKAVEVLGGLDFLVLNHIIICPLGEWIGSADNFTLLDRTMDINFKAYVHLTSHALAALTESRGSIVVVTSIAGRIAQPYVVAYSASKFALDGFYNGLRQEFLLRNVDVSITQCVIGLIGTENAVRGLKNFGLNFLFSALTPAEPADAAMAIIKGGTTRVREIYFPYMEARLSTLLRDLLPTIIEGFNRFVMQRG